MRVSKILKKMAACGRGRRWSKKFGDDIEAAWRACKRPGWMLWLVLEIDRTRYYALVEKIDKKFNVEAYAWWSRRKKRPRVADFIRREVEFKEILDGIGKKLERIEAARRSMSLPC